MQVVDDAQTSMASHQKKPCQNSPITNKDIGNDVTDDNQPDCCDSQCNCPVGSCLSVALTMKQLELKGIIQATEFTHVPVVNVLTQYKSSLYRPPIHA